MCDIVDTMFCHCVPVRMLDTNQIIVHISEGTMPLPGTEADREQKYYCNMKLKNNFG